MNHYTFQSRLDGPGAETASSSRSRRTPSHQTSQSPPFQAPQACERCYARKRKCDRRIPTCTACSQARVLCKIDISSSDKALIREVNELRARVIWLEKIICAAEPDLTDIARISTGQVITLQTPVTYQPRRSARIVQSGITASLSEIDLDDSFSHIASSLLSLQSPFVPAPDSHNTFLSAPPSASIHQYNNDNRPGVLTSTRDYPNLPSLDIALQLGRAFIDGRELINKVLAPDQLETDIRRTYEPGGMEDVAYASSRYRCFTALYLSSKNHREGDVVADTEPDVIQLFRTLSLRNVTSVFKTEDLACVQALTMMAAAAVMEPNGPSLWQIIGLAARTSIAIGIHRKDEIYLPTIIGRFDSEQAVHAHNNLRKDVFWAVYGLDRLTMFTLNRPAAIRECDIDVELPECHPNKIGGPIAVSWDAVNQHSIEGRRLYGSIQEAIYSIAAKPVGPQQTREGVVADFARRVGQWYASSPLKAAFIPISAATVRRQSLCDMQYHQMIMALHRPSPLLPHISDSFIHTLRSSSETTIELYRHYTARRQVTINWVHFHQIFTSCTTLVFCFAEQQSRASLQEAAPEEVLASIDRCKELIAGFDPDWSQSQRYRIMFDLLVLPLLARSNSAKATDRDAVITSVSITEPSAAHQLGVSSDYDFTQFLIPTTPTYLTSSPSTIMQGFWNDLDQ